MKVNCSNRDLRRKFFYYIGIFIANQSHFAVLELRPFSEEEGLGGGGFILDVEISLPLVADENHANQIGSVFGDGHDHAANSFAGDGGLLPTKVCDPV